MVTVLYCLQACALPHTHNLQQARDKGSTLPTLRQAWRQAMLVRHGAGEARARVCPDCDSVPSVGPGPPLPEA